MKAESSEVLEAVWSSLGGVTLDAEAEAVVAVGLAEADRCEVRGADEVFRERRASIGATDLRSHG